MMRYLFYFLVAFLFLTACKSTRSATGAGSAANEVPQTENALLWEITGKGLKKPSYLFGTIHMIGKSDFFLSEATKTSLSAAERVTFEINMEDMMDISNLMPLLMKSFMAGDTTLEDLLSADDYALVKNHFEKMGLPMMFLNRIKPMFLAAMTSEDMLSLGDGDSGGVVSYEMELMELAKADGKEIAGLETVEYQMSMFDSIPYKVQAEMLVEGMRSGNPGEDQFQEMVELYKNQDLEGMQKMMQNDKGGVGKYEDLLLIRRNWNWIPIMGEMMKDKPTFFAVGAGHLGGKQGVVALLRLKGYMLSPLK